MAASSTNDIPKTDCFLTHDWGVDEKGRGNHQRVAIINNRLKALGYVTWFDEERMEGEVRKRMVDGINGTNLVIVFVTKRYMNKVNGYGTNKNDNAKMEFDYAFDTKTREKMICVAMDDTMTNPTNWVDILKMTMGGCIFVEMNGDLDDETYLKKQMTELVKQLTLKGVTPSNAKKHCPKCKVQGQEAFCSKCGSRLQEVVMADGVKENIRTIPADIQKKLESDGFGYIDSLMLESDFDKLALLVEISMNLRNFQDDTPVLRAAALGNLKALKVLLKNGAKFDDVTPSGATILHRAAANGHVECVEYIAKTYPVLLSRKAKFDNTPLLYAVSFGKLNATKALIRNGANVNDMDESENTILHCPAANGYAECVEYIAKTYPPLLSCRNKHGNTPILHALLSGSLKATKSLIENGAHFDDVRDNGNTILHQAVIGDHVECVQYLAKTYPSLLSWKAQDGETPLLYSAAWGKLNSMKALIENGANSNDVNEIGNTILHRAASSEHVECVQYICRTYPVLLTQKNKGGYTALHLASYNGKLKSIKLLLDAGCDVSLKDPSGRSNIELARMGGHKECEKELMKW